jgi:hypothetical protein
MLKVCILFEDCRIGTCNKSQQICAISSQKYIWGYEGADVLCSV